MSATSDERSSGGIHEGGGREEASEDIGDRRHSKEEGRGR